jgi:sodium/potassium-transporting ATPase subunit alpha
MPEIWGVKEIEVLKELGTSEAGLTDEEAELRFAQYGPNSLEEIKGPSRIRAFLKQFTHFLAILLWIAAALSFMAEILQPGQGMATLGWAILSVILINAVFTFVQEYKAERAVLALRRLLPVSAWVVRAGHPVQIQRQRIVPGDILLLEEGEHVPADARLIEAIQMRVDNSSLTGEPHPKRRHAEPVTEGKALDSPNLVFAGTAVVTGRGRAVVYATGGQTEFGKIAHLAATVEPGLSPLQREIVRVTHVVALLSLVMGVIFFLIGVWAGSGPWVSFIFGIGIIVANVPEGLLPTVTLALAAGSQRMARRKALIKQLTSVETLGCATVICTDKTGTLTENRMSVDRLYVRGVVLEARESKLVHDGQALSEFERDVHEPLLLALACCNNVKRVRRSDGLASSLHRSSDGGMALVGDPTEVALVEFSRAYGPPGIEPLPRMGELPFDADRKRMTTMHWVHGKLIAYVKGAPEVLLRLCYERYDHGYTMPMTPSERETILQQSRAFAQDGYRVLAVAMRDLQAVGTNLDSETVEHDLSFLGLVALMDPLHREVPDAVARCRKAGIRVIMITGDHPLTALAVARRSGLVEGLVHDAKVIEGEAVDVLSDPDLQRMLQGGQAIFARMRPLHKMRIVSVLKDMGEVVAVTGDGVNDAPAIQKADIGIAMGMAGTDVAKATADMILLDDNFATIVNAIEEGRTVYGNIRKFVTYVLSSNVPEVVPYLAFGLFRIPLPLTIPQILAVDLGTDMMPALALGMEPPHAGVMDMPPRSRSERLLSLPLLLRAYAFLGLIEAGVAMGAFFWFLKAHGWTWGVPFDWNDPVYRQATTITFAAIVVAQVANVFACRSERVSVFRLGVLTNRYLLWGIAIELALLALIVYTPLGHTIFGTEALPAWMWWPLMAGAAGLLLAEEIRKAAMNLFDRLRRKPA